ncbi:MAG: hypothetical protein ABS35_18340 [Kaistia sp. SCN 65-12]|nr:MAG: hypothetical protein ABS35_18340 [Kaistia sp. SCN 65-12]
MSIRLPRHKKLLDVDEAFPISERPIELLSITQAATFAGVAPITVRRWVRQRLMPAYRAGAQIRIDRVDLIKFIRNY